MGLRIGGVTARIHPAFLVLLAVAVLGGQGLAVAVVLALLASHELAHLALAQAAGLRVREVELLPFGGIARVEGLEGAPAALRALLALAGPLDNLLLLALGVALRQAGWAGGPLLDFFLEGNLSLALFNLLPVLPLDGGRLAQLLLARRLGEAAAGRRLRLWGARLGALLFGAGVALALAGVLVPNLPVLGGFLLLTARRPPPEEAFRSARELLRLRLQGAPGEPLPVRALAVPRGTALLAAARNLASDGYHVFWVIDPEGRVAGTVDQGRLLEGLLRLGGAAPIERLLDP
ncbi:MAG: site-2 protease family protein [Bacillota bacterium]|nr:site-2 protease family protein [Bacillota bacterium]